DATRRGAGVQSRHSNRGPEAPPDRPRGPGHGHSRGNVGGDRVCGVDNPPYRTLFHRSDPPTPASGKPPPGRRLHDLGRHRSAQPAAGPGPSRRRHHRALRSTLLSGSAPPASLSVSSILMKAAYTQSTPRFAQTRYHMPDAEALAADGQDQQTAWQERPTSL